MRRVMASAAAALVLAACDGARVDRSGVGNGAASTPAAGLALELRSVEVASGAAPVVTFRATDGAGAPLDLASEIAAGAIAPRFVLARRGPDGAYLAYLLADVPAKPYVDASGALRSPTGSASQPIPDPGYGVPAWPLERLVAKGDGVYAYTFGAAVTGVDPAATHLAGVYATRTVGTVLFPASSTLDFVPAGGAPAPREEVVDAACGKCHAVVQYHDERRGVRLCLACHTTQNADPETGNPLDLGTLVHRIHDGAGLAKISVPWQIVGYRQALHDYGHVSMAPSHSTYFELSAPGTGAGAAPVNDPGIVRDCALCHQGADADRHRTAPSRVACGSCHAAVDFTTGANHVVNGVATPAVDADCAGCHTDATSASPIAVRHSARFETTRKLLFGEHRLEITIDAVRNAAAGQAPLVDFTIRLDGNPFDPLSTPLGSLAFQIAGPITDYGSVVPTAASGPTTSSALLACNPAGVSLPCKADPNRVTAIDPGAGRFTFAFKSAEVVPADAAGTYVVSYEAMFKETQAGPNGETVSKPYAADPVFRGDARNVFYVDVASGGPSSSERRAVVATSKCNACHEDLGFHSNRSRKGLDYCATCHGPNLSNATRARFQASDTAVMSSPSFPGFPTTPVFVAESVASRVFIHRIHMGAELPTVKAGGAMRLGAYGGAISDYSRLELPGGAGRCTACHEEGAYALPTRPGLLAVRRAVLDCSQSAGGWCTGRVLVDGAPLYLTIPPLKAVCTSCHDDPATSAHADLHTVGPMTPGAIETCAACHGPGKDLDSLVVHAPAP